MDEASGFLVYAKGVVQTNFEPCFWEMLISGYLEAFADSSIYNRKEKYVVIGGSAIGPEPLVSNPLDRWYPLHILYKIR